METAEIAIFRHFSQALVDKRHLNISWVFPFDCESKCYTLTRIKSARPCWRLREVELNERRHADVLTTTILLFSRYNVYICSPSYGNGISFAGVYQ